MYSNNKGGKMSRAVLLPTPGDPFLLYYWLNNYERVWRDEIDKLYICVNGQTDKEVLSFFKELIGGVTNAEYIEFGTMIDHGNAIDKLLDLCGEKYVMLAEDDAFVVKSGQVDKCFKLLESGEKQIVGSRRGSCSAEILEKAKGRWGLDYSGFGDNGCNFWPAFLFTSKELLTATDREFGAKQWQPGEYIKGLDMIADELCVGDTLVNTSLQLRGMVKNSLIESVPQYHGATDDEPDYLAKTNIWSPDCCWLHVGSLSSGVYGLLDLNRELSRDHFRTHDERMELERRVTFWTIFASSFKENVLKKQLKDYKEALHRLVKHYELDRNRITKRITMYQEVLNG